MPRFGLAFNGLVAIPDGLGVGLRGRAATALNPDLSLALDVGATGFIVGGNRGADYVIDPQFSVIINLNSAKTYNPGLPTRQTYLIAGAGAYIPVGEERDESAGGATLHAGLGWVQPLTTTSVFYEFDPALVIGGKNDVGVTVPFRVGLIF